MKKKLFHLLAVFLTLSSFHFATAQAPGWDWARSAGTLSDDRAYSVSADLNGNTYVTGLFNGTITFGSYTLSTVGIMDVFLVKYDVNGTVLWATSFGGTGQDEGNSVHADANGNVYVAGFYYSPTIVIGSTTLTNTGSSDVFVAKYDAAGTFLWATSATGSGNDIANSVSADANGNVYLTGSFRSSPTIAFGSIILTNNSPGMPDVFLVKYDAAGTELWGQSAGSSNNDYSYSVAAEANGNTVIVGQYQGASITFGSTTLTNGSGSDDIFIVKYDANGTVLWARDSEGSGTDVANSVSLDGGGNVYVTGSFSSAVITFSPSTLVNGGSLDMFIVKYNAAGTLLWANRAGGTGTDYGRGIAVDANGNSYVTGDFFSSTITFGSTTLSNTGNNQDIYLVKYDAAGNAIWAKSVGSASMGYDYGYSVDADPNGNIFVAGEFWGPTIYFSSTMANTDNAGATCDMFLSKICNAQAVAGPDVSFCAGGSVQLSASGGTMYNWQPSTGLSAPTAANPVASPTITTIYTVTVVTANGCTDTDTITVTVNPLPNANAGSNAFICMGNSTPLSATGGVGYLWSPASGLSSTTIANPVANPTVTTTYYVTVSSVAGCTAVDSVMVTVFPLPVANAGTDVAICIGGNTNLNATGGSTYSWTPVSTLSNANISNPIATPTITTTYAVVVTSGNGCSATDSVVVTVNQLPVINASAGNITCSGGTVQLNATGGSTYVWTPATGLNNPNIANPIATVTVSTTYTVTGTDLNGCVNTSTVTAVVYSLSNAICLATVDSISAYNQVAWDKPVTTDIDSFRIYREISSNFVHIGSVPYSAYSVYKDSIYVPLANPNNTNYRYKIAVVDTCGNVGVQSTPHRTLFLQASQGVGNTVNLSWNLYEGNPVNQYIIYRDTVGTGNLDSIDVVPGSNTVYTDNNPSQNITTLRYVLGVDWGVVCNPTLRNSQPNVNPLAAINNTKSNLKTLAFNPQSISEWVLNNFFVLAPNPNNGIVMISLGQKVEGAVLKVYDNLGRIVYSEKLENGMTSKTYDWRSFASGVYDVTLEVDHVRVHRKMAIRQ